MPDKILFLTLRTFSATGGIEKVCRILGKALYEDTIKNGGCFELCSMYDEQQDADDNLYFPAEHFRGFGVNKLSFINDMVKAGAKHDVIILSHINLVMVGWLIKKLNPRVKLFLLAHGIEIWYPLSKRKKYMLGACDYILAVSNYTKNKVIETHAVSPDKCRVLNNCLDPFLPLPSVNKKNKRLMDKYGFSINDKILMTLTRLSSKERYKGYEKVIEAIAALQPGEHQIKYLIAGSYDREEKLFLEKLISNLGLEKNVVMSGYIQDEELEDHFAMTDVYIMPSRKEGFGIVFIEAMYYGLPVIAGNIDGSTDALLNGRLGQLVNPDNVGEITQALAKVLSNEKAFIPDRKLMMQYFGYEEYKRKLEDLLYERKALKHEQV